MIQQIGSVGLNEEMLNRKRAERGLSLAKLLGSGNQVIGLEESRVEGRESLLDVASKHYLVRSYVTPEGCSLNWLDKLKDLRAAAKAEHEKEVKPAANIDLLQRCTEILPGNELSGGQDDPETVGGPVALKMKNRDLPAVGYPGRNLCKFRIQVAARANFGKANGACRCG